MFDLALPVRVFILCTSMVNKFHTIQYNTKLSIRATNEEKNVILVMSFVNPIRSRNFGKVTTNHGEICMEISRNHNCFFLHLWGKYSNAHEKQQHHQMYDGNLNSTDFTSFEVAYYLL